MSLIIRLKMSKRMQVRNRAPAPIQISAEQLLREAKERGLEDVSRAPKLFIADREELQQYQQGKRKDFEDQIRRQRQHIGTWCKYGLWEASQKEFDRARSVFERGLDVDYRNEAIWFKYAEMEMKNKFVNHARNIWDRAVALHPRVDAFWYKYTYMEELVGAIEAARQAFERWMKWTPDDNAWSAYIKFEMRQGEIGRSRGLYERYIECHPTCRAFLKYAKWEEKQYQKGNARAVFERALSELHEFEKTDSLLLQFARFEERCKEVDRARVIYKYALDHTEVVAKKQELDENVSSEDVDNLDKAEKDVNHVKQEFLAFEKRHGDRGAIEEVLVSQKRSQYEKVM